MQNLKRFGAVLASLLVLFSLAPVAYAQNAGVSGSGLSISPTLAEFNLQPGQSSNVVITLKDSSAGSITAEGVVNDFTSDGSSGNPKLLLNTGESSPNSIKTFVYQLDNVPLTPGEQKDITVGIHIPNGTSPGAYYGVIRYKAVPQGAAGSGQGKVALTASVGTIVLITVPGKVRELVKVGDLHIYHGTQDSSLFFTKPNNIGVEIQNLGNGFEKPFGTVTVQNTFHKVVDNFKFNNPVQLGSVLPNSTRIFIHPATGISQFGRYTATASIAYGNGSNIVTVSKTFWYIPAWIAITIVVILAILALLTIRLYVKYRRGTRHKYRR